MAKMGRPKAESPKQKLVSVRLTKEEHEKSKTITDILEEIKQEMCDEYCKYPTLVDDREDLFADDSPCMKCPLTRL